MKKVYFLLYLIIFFPLCLSAQNDLKALDILKKAENFINHAGCIRAGFEAGEHGLLLMKGEKFYLNCAGIQTWFDGKTQWSYVEANEEVSITTPTQEELQFVNPYMMIKSYHKGYNCQLVGNKTLDGKQGTEILLTPQKKQDISSITLFISSQYIPLYIKIEQKNQPAIEFKVTTCQYSQRINDEIFIFDKNKYPDAEIIDLR